MLERARAVLAKQPFSALLGTSLTRFGDGEAELSLELSAELRQQHGFAHGGVIAYLADNALTFAAGTVFEDALTLETKLNFVRPARGDRLIATARVAHAGKRQAVVRCDVVCVDGEQHQLCALAQGTISRLEPKP
jgi:uncharacterized protein (TIGR00369 family)